MSNYAWFPFYVGDYLRDTMHLSTAEHGAYVLLMIAYWSRRGPLPDDDRTLSATVSATMSEWSEIRSAVAGFFEIEGGVWRHKRIEEELSRAKRTHESRQKGALKTNSSRKQTHYQQVKPFAPPSAERVAERTLSGALSGPVTDTLSVVQSQSHTDGGVGGEVELPSSFPKTEEQAVQWATGHDPEFVAKVWNKAASRGGRDARDVVIRSWPRYVATEAAYERDRTARESGPYSGQQKASYAKPSAPAWQQLKALEELIEQTRNALSRLQPPNRDLYPDQYAEVMAKRNPLVEELRRLMEKKTSLQRSIVE